jgi:hypothetical protein
MYDAYAMVDMIKSPQQEAVREAMQAGVQRVLDQKRATAIQEPTQRAQPSASDDAIRALVEKAIETKSEADVSAAREAINTALAQGNRTDAIMEMQVAVRSIKLKAATKPKAVKADIAPSAPVIAETSTPEAPKKASKYESMGYNALQKEAKKRGINSFGVKKAELIRQIEEKDADTEKTNAKKASVYDNSAEIEGIVVGKSADEIKSALTAKLTELKKQGYTSFIFKGKEFSIQEHLDVLARQAKDQAKKDKFLNSKSYKDFIDKTKQQNKAYKDMLAKAERKEPLTIAEAEGFATGVPKGYIKDGDMYIHKDSASAKVESVEPYSNRSKMNREALRNEKKARLRSLEEMKARGVKSVKIGAKQMTIDKAIDVTRKSMGISLLDEYNAEQKVSPTLSEDDKWKIYKARKEFERYVKAPSAYGLSKKELDNALKKLNALESEYGVPNTLADGTRGGDIYEQKDVTPIEYTGKSDGKIDRNLVDAIKSGEAWMHNATTSEEWNIAMAEMKEEGTFWGIKDQDIVDQGIKIMEEIDELLDEIDNIENTTENREKIKEIEAKIKVLQEKHKDLWDNAKSDQSSQDTTPVKAAEAEGVEIDSNFDAADIEAGDARRNLPEVVARRIDTAWTENEKLTKDNKSKFGELWRSHGTNIEAYLDAMSRRGFTGKDQQAIIRWLNEARRLRIESEKRRDNGDSAKAEGAPKIQPDPMSRSSFQEQYRQAQKGKLTAEQIDAQLKLYDAMMDTYAKEMGITIDEAYAEVIDSVTADEPVGGTAAFDPSNPDNRFQGEVTSGAAIESTVIPKKTVSAYRIGYLNPDGTVSPVMVDNKTTRQSYKMGTWYDAETRKSSMAIIPGFHFAYTPSLPQLYKEDGTLDPQRVYYIAEYDATNNYQAEADASGEGFIRGKIPENGFYFRKKKGIKGWAISGKMRPVRVLTMQEVDEINRQNGIETINGMPIEIYKAKQAKYKAKKGIREQNLQQLTRGYIQQMPNGKYRIGIMQPNVTTGLHEQAHLGKSLMEIMAAKSPAWASRLKAAEEWCGVKDGNWTTEAEEKFANGYVKFLADGSAPNGKLKTIFAKIKEWIGSILQGLADVKNLNVSNEMRGVYLAMLGVSDGKRNLTSEQKVQSIKLKSAMRQDATSDPLKLETEIDSFADSNDLILEGKRTGNKTSFYLNRIDDGKTMIEIHHSNGEYEVNGYHAANNQEVMEQVTRILGDTRYQTTDMPSAAEIAEAERQMAEVRAKYEGTDQWMKAPNGKPTKLNERQWLQVRTQLFKDWFGDWENDPANASKVVEKKTSSRDANGEPIPMYHGTIYDFTEFKANMPTHNTDMFGRGYETKRNAIFFADNPINSLPFTNKYGDKNGFTVGGRTIPVFLNMKNPFYANDEHTDAEYESLRELGYTKYDVDNIGWGYLDDELGDKFVSDLQKLGYDGIILNDEHPDTGDIVTSYAVFTPTQIKSAAANVGTFSESNDIRYQQIIDEAVASASDMVRERIVKVQEKAKRAQQSANITYRMLKETMDKSLVVAEWDSAMRKSLVTAIRKAFPGAAPMNIVRYAALEEALGDLDPGIEDHAKEISKIKAQLRRMIRMDKKFREALEDVSGFSDIADIPLEGLFAALENTNPAAYDRYMKDPTLELLMKVLPKVKKEFGDEYAGNTLQRIVDVTLNGSDDAVGRASWEIAFMQPQRLLAELFSLAGVKTVDYGYRGILQVAAYEQEYEPSLKKIHKYLLSHDNNRGSTYEGDDIDAIGRIIYEIDGNPEIEDKLPAIQARIAEWAERNDAIINSNDVEEIYGAKEELKTIMRGFIAEWNADPEHTVKIGLREDYDNPRKYMWGNVGEITSKPGKYIYTPGNAKKRAAEAFDASKPFETNIFEAYRNYMYGMTKYMAFYDLANYVEENTIFYQQGSGVGKRKMASGFDIDLPKAQRKSSAYASRVLEEYVRNTIGYRSKDTPKGRLLKAARTNIYTSLLAGNVIMIALNYNQRNLIHAVVDNNIAMQVKKDIGFWGGMLEIDNDKYPTLSRIMQAYVVANQSLIAELSADAKRSADEGRTAATRAYYKYTALNAELLRISPFSLAELGNRAYAHAAGVYQIAQNSKAFKDYMADGMTRHEAMERVLTEDATLRRAAITYGGIINAEINADANPAFSPNFFSESTKLKSLAMFIRYGTTISLLELRTYGGARDLQSMLSPDLYRLLTSGNVKAARAGQAIQAGLLMKSMLDPKRVEKLVKRGDVSRKKYSENLMTVDQVAKVREAITWALDEQAASTTKEYSDIIRGKKGSKAAMAKLMSFSISEVILRTLLELLFSLIPWRQGKKKIIETDLFENIATLMGLFQTTKTASNIKIGGTLVPDLGYYTRTNKQVAKAFSQAILRLTPFVGLANYTGKVFTGKYFSDQFWDAVMD